MMSTPLVSVVTPTKRRPELLYRTMLSVAQQSYSNIQHVIVGDDCPDLWNVATVYAQQFPQALIVNVCSNYNDPCTSTYRAARTARIRNIGIKLATGKYIAHLDDDDTYDVDHIARLVSVLESEPSLGAAHSYRKIFERDGTPHIIKHHLWLPADSEEERKEYKRWVEMGNYVPNSNIIQDRMYFDGGPVVTVGMDEWMVRADVHQRIMFREFYSEDEQRNLLTEDTALAIDFVEAGVEVGCSPFPTLNVFLGGYSTTNQGESYYES